MVLESLLVAIGWIALLAVMCVVTDWLEQRGRQ